MVGADDELNMMDWTPHNHVFNRHKPFLGSIDNVPRLSPGESLRFTDEHGKRRALRNEQKSISLLKELICRFTKPGDVVVDLYGGTYSVGVACLTLGKGQNRVLLVVKKICLVTTWLKRTSRMSLPFKSPRETSYRHLVSLLLTQQT